MTTYGCKLCIRRRTKGSEVPLSVYTIRTKGSKKAIPTANPNAAGMSAAPETKQQQMHTGKLCSTAHILGYFLEL